MRVYERNKYVQIKYRTIENAEAAVAKKSSENKQGNEKVMSLIWKLMKYTQGGNKQKVYMKLLMPVFVSAETLTQSDTLVVKSDEEAEALKQSKLIEIAIRMSLPAEYQGPTAAEPPTPKEPEISFEILEEIKYYVRYNHC